MRIIPHKGIYMLLAGSLMFSTMPAYAESLPTMAVKELKTMVSLQDQKTMENTKISKDKALQIAQNAAQIPEGYTLQNVEFQSNWWGSHSPSWVFYWNHQGQDYGNIQVAVDANNGKIVNMDITKNPTEALSYPPRVDINKAKEIAWNYVLAHYPDKIDQIQLDEWSPFAKPPLSGNVLYPIVYKRTVNGIVFDNNEIRVTVNGNGDIMNLGYRWSDTIQFPNPENHISQEEALKIYADHLNLSLHLIQSYGATPDGPRDFIAYMPSWMGNSSPFPLSFLRATDGAFLTPWGDEIKPNQMEKVRISDHKLGALQEGKELNQEQALKVLSSYFTLPQNTEMVRASYREQTGDITASIWDFNWEQHEKGNPRNWSSASIDAKTGRILNYYNGDQMIYTKAGGPESLDQKFVPKLSRAEGEKIATDLIEKLNPDLADTIYLLRTPISPYEEENPRVYNYQFVVEKNGVSLESNGIGVSIDSTTGAIVNYWFNLENMKLPENLPAVINKEKAQEIYLGMTKMRLTYVLPEEKPGVKPVGNYTNSDPKAILVYQPLFKQVGEQLFLDANSGQWLNRETGKPYIEEQTITDITGNPYEKELRLLLPYHVFDVTEGKIHPNEEISRGEMIKMLMLIQNNGYYPIDLKRKATFNDVGKESPLFSYVEHAVEQNLLNKNSDQLKPNEKINRQELAELVLRALGYYSLLDVPNLFTVDLKDASSMNNPAAAELITKLKIMNTMEGSFLPVQHVTRGEAASVFYRYLTKKNPLVLSR